MERLAIIDHETHELFIEDVDEGMLKKEYGGSEQAYIEDTYELSRHWSWDYITSIEYVPENEDPIVIDPKDLI